ncbi:MAG TPA: fumarylacetoacetate hydrolase family protein [Thermomonospora sp.]|nr:fumarylacetoacetate hydrolase family protein [Thermomonospora sp.]
MQFVSYRDAAGAEAVGRVEGGRAHRLRDVAGIDATVTPERLRDAAADPEGVPLEELTLLPVAPRPGKVFCVGLNYRSHIDETGRELPTYPVWFPKYASNLIGHGAPIALPPESRQVDYEAELAVVIGRGGRRITREEAPAHVLGYTIGNDVTMRDFQYKTHQWMQGKAWDGSTPLGPVLVTPDEIDPGKLDIALRLNGREMQSSNTSRLIFDIPELISVASRFTRLEPGDVILTGTPGGVGFRRDPQVFLADGDVVEVEIEGLGVLRNTVRAESA